MNKNKVLLGIVCLLVLFTLTGCFNKTAITKYGFVTKAESNDYEIFDVSEQYASYDFVETATIAKKSNDWQVEFYELDDDESAIGMFNENKTIFEQQKESVNNESTTSANNYVTYTLITNNNYMYLSQVDNTLLYINVQKEYKAEVQKFVEALGY